MADEFDPLKQANNQPVEELYSTIQRKTVINNNNNDDDLLRSPFDNVLKLTNYQLNRPLERQPFPEQQSFPEPKPKEELYQTLDFTSNAYKAPVRSTNPFDEDVAKSSSSSPSATTNVIQQLPQARPIVSEKPTQPHWTKFENDYDGDYDIGHPQGYHPGEYDHVQASFHKKKGFAATIDRFVQRFPVLGIFYKQPPTTFPEQEDEYFEEEGDEPPQLVDASQSARELTPDELALHERYSNKSCTQIIQLQNKSQTQPIDVRFHHENSTFYLCDVGRSVVEIFDMNGKLQHVIDDQTTLTFQPTAIAVHYDGTIIVASHFNHCLHMYSPDLNEYENSSEVYRFKHYKLGSSGHKLHQFYNPAGIALDPNDGYLYICDQGNSRIQVMRPEGVCERVIDLILNDRKQSPVPPIQVAAQRTREQIVCLVGTGDALCFISKYADGPTFVEPLYVLDNDGLGLQGASGLAVDSSDRIFISDTGHHRIVICTSDGSYITHFGAEGSGPGELKRPCGLDFTNDGTVVVVDAANKRLQLFGLVKAQAVEEKNSTNTNSDDKMLFLIDPEGPVS